MSKYGVFSVPYLPVFSPNPVKYFACGHFLHIGANVTYFTEYVTFSGITDCYY